MVVYYEKRILPDYDLCRVLYGFKRDEIFAYDDDLKYLRLKSGDIFVGDIWRTENVLRNSGVTWNKIPDYPDKIWENYGRKIERVTLQQVFERDATKPKFVKPVVKGLFQPIIHSVHYDPMSLFHINPECDVWMQEVIDIKGEYRVFVCDGEILDVRCYGLWDAPVPTRFWLEWLVEKMPYNTYIMDVGAVEDGFVVVEFNDGISFGSYGLQPEHCAMMYRSRFKQIWEENDCRF